MSKFFFPKVALLFLLGFSHVFAGDHGEVRVVSIDSAAIRGNPAGNSAQRSVAVYLPPSYRVSERRYPVLYLLHGTGDNHLNFVDDDRPERTIQHLVDEGVRRSRFGEMIVVTPDESTRFGGSFYVNSASTGNWEDFTVKELVEFIDTNFRTLPAPGSRALAGHSMGGFGALWLSFRHPDIFGIVYGLNPGLLSFDAELATGSRDLMTFTAARSPEAITRSGRPYAIGMIMVAQAFSPDPKDPEFLAQKPYRIAGGRLVPRRPAYDRWKRFDLVGEASRYLPNLLRLKAIKFDCANGEDIKLIGLNSRRLSAKLASLGVPHQFEEYYGDHRNRLWGFDGRIYNELLPFVSDNFERP